MTLDAPVAAIGSPLCAKGFSLLTPTPSACQPLVPLLDAVEMAGRSPTGSEATDAESGVAIRLLLSPPPPVLAGSSPKALADRLENSPPPPPLPLAPLLATVTALATSGPFFPPPPPILP